MNEILIVNIISIHIFVLIYEIKNWFLTVGGAWPKLTEPLTVVRCAPLITPKLYDFSPNFYR